MIVADAQVLGSGERGQADGSAAEHDQAVGGRRLEHVQHGAGAGLEAAAVRCDLGQVDGLVDDHAVVGVGDGVLGEAGLAEEVAEDGRPVAAVRRAAIHPHAHVVEQQRRVAVADQVVRAVLAAAAGPEREHDVVADLDTADVFADGLDDAGALVTEDVGEHLRRQEALEVDVGVAQTGRDDLDEDLVGLRIGELDLLEGEVRALRVHNSDSGLHTSRSSQK